jgi:pimeloyl-ACP methyl ester carboxylesterase
MLISSPRLTRCYVDTPLGQIHCRVAEPTGKALFPPVLCLHMTAKSSWSYQLLLELLGTTRLVVAPDTPGFGMSDPPARQPNISDYSDALSAVPNHFAPDATWDAVGCHTGALIAIDMALRRPQMIGRLVLVALSLLTETEIREYRALGLLKPRVWDDAGEALLALWKLLVRVRMPGSSLAVCARSLADTLLAGDNGWWGMQAAFEFPTAAALKMLKHPFSIINPGDDLCVATRRARALRPDAVFIEQPAWKHGFLHEVPDQAAAVIEPLLSR